MKNYPNENELELIEALSLLKNKKEITFFLRDLMTVSEIEEFTRRWQIAKLLWTTNKPYLEIAKKIGTSSTTVTRVANWLYREDWQGYAKVLKRLYGKSMR